MHSNNTSQIVAQQILNLVQTITKKNYRACAQEIEKLISQFGYEAYRFLFRSLFQEINFNSLDTNQEEQARAQLLTQEIAQLTRRPNLIPLVAEAIDIAVQVPKSEFLTQITRALSLPLAQQVLLGCALTQSNNTVTQQEGITFLKSILTDIKEQGPTVLPENIVHIFLTLVNINTEFAKEREAIMQSFESYRTMLQASPLFMSPEQVASSQRDFTQGGIAQFVQQLQVVGQGLEQTNDLSGVIQELGYACLASERLFSAVLDKFHNLSERDIAHVIGIMAMNHTGLVSRDAARNAFYSTISAELKNEAASKSSTNTWNIDNFVNVITKKLPNLNWKNVILNLGSPNFRLADQKGLALITAIYRRATGDMFPVECVCCVIWTNTRAQLDFIRLALDAPPDVINFGASHLRRVNLGEVATLNRTPQAITWGCLDLIETLLNLATDGGEHYNIVRGIFAESLKECPEALVVGLAEARPMYTKLQMELLSVLLPLFIQPHKNSFVVLHQIYQVHPQLLIGALINTYIRDPTTLRRILDIVQELKCLLLILQSPTAPFRFTIELATLGAKRDGVNLELWLTETMKKYRGPFIRECITFLDEKIKLLKSGEEKDKREALASVSSANFATFFKCLKAALEYEPEFTNSVSELQKSVGPELLQAMGSESEFRFDPTIERQSNEYFSRIFKSALSVKDAIELLKRLKSSKEKHDQELFACMIHNLFEESQHFPRFPPTELSIGSKLFGSLIQHGIVQGRSLKYALYVVLTSLSDPKNSKLFNFGIIALNEFKTRLAEWPQFGEHLKGVLPHIAKAIPDIGQYMSGTPSSSTTTSGSKQPSSNVGLTPGRSRSISSTSSNDETRTKGVFGQPDGSALASNANAANILHPPEKIMDEIHFVINNVSPSNVEEKASDLQQLLKEEYEPYVANYIVAKRASLEPNFHHVYLKLLSLLNNKSLDKHVLKQTYANARILLQSEKVKTSMSERALLKNLGEWLGQITIAKNKPILQKDLDVKALLFEAYETGRLTAIIPFVCKILSHCANSKVFKPNNPWVAGIISVLAEIHAIPVLKLNVKFEIESLCKRLNKTVADYPPKGQLVGRTMPKSEDNPDIHMGKLMALQEMQSRQGSSPAPGQQQQQQHHGDILQLPNLHDIEIIIPGLLDAVHFNEEVALFQRFPDLRILVAAAVDSCIRELMEPFVKRSVAIACRTTADLIRKDFAVEKDANKMRTAAALMVQDLASKLAIVTCKDPMRSGIEFQLKHYLGRLVTDPQSIEAKNMIEEATIAAAKDNTDLACQFVEQAAVERALVTIVELLAPEFEQRLKFQQSNGQVPWTHYVPNQYSLMLPESLYPKYELKPVHLKVYEEYAARPSEEDFTLQRTQEKIEASMQKIIAEYRQLNKNVTLAALSPDSEIVRQILLIPSYVKQCVNTPEAAYLLVQQTVLGLFECAKTGSAGSRLQAEIFMAILRGTRRVCRHVPDHVTNFWINSIDNRTRFHPGTVAALMSEKLFSSAIFDSYVSAVLIKRPDVGDMFNLAMEMIITVIKTSMIQDRVVSARHIPQTMNVLINSPQWHREFSSHGLSTKLLEEALQVEPQGSSSVTNTVREMLQNDFDPSELNSVKGLAAEKIQEWMRISDHQYNARLSFIQQFQMNWQQDQSQQADYFAELDREMGNLQQQFDRQKEIFVAQLNEAGLLNTSNGMFSKLCRVLMEFSADSYRMQTPPRTLMFDQQDRSPQTTVVDAFTGMIVCIVRFVEPSQKDSLFQMCLTTVAKTLVREHEYRMQNFDQKVYLRFFSNILCELHESSSRFGGAVQRAADGNSENSDMEPSESEFRLLSIVADVLGQLHPAVMPAFSFAWIELLCHRFFMPKLLLMKDQKGWPRFHTLLVSLLEFMYPHLANAELTDSIRVLYRATLKIFLILLHDFAEFLCSYHFSLGNAVPANCVQLRNLVLSAFPKNMRLPDPFTPDLDMAQLSESKLPPRTLDNVTEDIERAGIKPSLDRLLSGKMSNDAKAQFLRVDIKEKLLLLPTAEALAQGERYNVAMVNSLVLYVGAKAIRREQQQQQPKSVIHQDVFCALANELDSEGRYHLIGALANQLRYPNNHTHYFKRVLLSMFANGDTTIKPVALTETTIQEQITRVLLERLIVNRPHPWGLLVTFLDLIKNKEYRFWQMPFIHVNEMISQLFRNLNY